MKKLILFSLFLGITIMSDAKSTKWKLETPLIPREVLFGMDDPSAKSGLRLSPDGQQLIFSAPVNKVYNLFLCKKDENGKFNLENSTQITFETEQHIGGGQWMHTNKHLLYTQDNNGDENAHLYLIDIESEKITDLTPFDGVKVFGAGTDKKYPNKIMISMNKDNPQVRDLYSLDITGDLGDLQALTQNPGDVFSYIANDDWQIRGTMKMKPDGGMLVSLRKSDDEEFKPFIDWNMEDADISGFLDFYDDTHVYIIDAKGSNTGRLKKVNFETGEEESLAYDPNYEIGNVSIHPDTKEIISYNFEKDRNKPVILDEAFKTDYEFLENLEEGDLMITSMDVDMNVWLCCFAYDNEVHTYYHYDRRTKEVYELTKSSTKFDPYTLVHMEPMSYKTRDGLTVHGYLSLPQGKTTNMPLVLYVHGGPQARDSWGLDGAAQWLCNRGYAVLQVNYRGSTGYGKEFIKVANKEWGRTMHNDLVDAVQWAVDSKIADPDKVAIFGSSYGGYAALAGVTFTPDLFCCAVDIVGPSNLLTLMDSFPPYWKPFLERMKLRIGDPETEEAMLKERSPLFSAHKIKKPLLIGQGANDPRVKQAESEQIVAALKENNCDYIYKLYHDEGHGFRKHENRMDFYAEAEKFLARYLGGRYE